MSEVVEAVVVMTKAEAERITTRIELRLSSASENFHAGMQLIREAIEGSAHEVLGFASPGAYLAEKFGDVLAGVGVDLRREAIRELSDMGLSSRAIAPAVGVTDRTVRKDLASGGNQVPTSGRQLHVDDVAGLSVMASTRAELIDIMRADGDAEVQEMANTIEPRKITGMDGKQYTRPEPNRPRRRPLPDAANTAGWELRKAVEKIERILNDDRYAANAGAVHDMLRSHVLFALDALHEARSADVHRKKNALPLAATGEQGE